MYYPSASSTLHPSSIDFKLLYLIGSVQGSVATEIVTLGAIQIVSQAFGTITVQPNPLPINAHAVLQRWPMKRMNSTSQRPETRES